MNTNSLVERLYEDESLTSNLRDQEAVRLLSWAESLIRASINDGMQARLFDTIRILNRTVGAGVAFEDAFRLLLFPDEFIPFSREDSSG